MQEKTFRDVQLESWSQKAGIYDEMFASMSIQAIAPILDSVGVLRGKRHLDVACGTGHIVAAARRRGAASEGIDFAPPMIEVAQANYPDAKFQVADATQLPYEDSQFDVVTCSFGLLHFTNPQQAVDEAFRVLKPGGHYVFTLWFGPDAGNELYALIRSALEKHATCEVSLPPTWTVSLRYADEATCRSILQKTGFIEPAFQVLPLSWRSTDPRDVLDFIDRLSLRTATLINSQPPDTRHAVREQVVADVEARRRDGVVSLAWPALLTIARKPLDADQ